MEKIHIFDTSQITKRELSALASDLSRQEKDRAGRFVFENDYKLYTAGKIMARKKIAELTGVKPDDVVFRIDKHDRPFLEYPNIKNFDFNISHSGNFVVLAMGQARVGVDIEQVKLIDLEIACDCFHDKELAYMRENDDQQLGRFYQVWTLKESFIKAVGQGLSYPLKKFYFNLSDSDDIKINIIGNEAENKAWNFRDYDLSPEYKLAACVRDATPPASVDILTAFI